MSKWPAAPQLEDALEQLAAEAQVDTPARAALATQLLERDRPVGDEPSGPVEERIEPIGLIDQGDGAPGTSRPRRRGAVVMLVAAAVIAAIVVGGGLLLESGDGDSDRIVTEPTTTEADDQAPVTTLPPRPTGAAGAVVGTPIELPVTGLTYLKVDEGSVWVANQTDQLHRIDPDTNQVSDTVELDFAATDMGTGSGSMWVGHAEGYVTEVDATTGEIRGVFDVGWPVDGMAYGSGSVWIASGGITADEGAAIRLDPTTGATTVIPMSGGAFTVEEMDGTVWVVNPQGQTVSRIDASDNSLTVVPTGPSLGLDADHSAVWVAVTDRALRLDPATGEVIAAVPAPADVALNGPNIGPRFVWVYGLRGCGQGPCDAVVMRIDPDTNEVVEVIEMPAPAGAFGIWIGPNDVYLGVGDVGLVPISIQGGP